jgi:ribonuclease Y
MGFEGVEKAYAIQAGREIRILVANEKIDDTQAAKLAFDISRKLEKELEYPGHIKVVVIRETRVVEFAR